MSPRVVVACSCTAGRQWIDSLPRHLAGFIAAIHSLHARALLAVNRRLLGLHRARYPARLLARAGKRFPAPHRQYIGFAEDCAGASRAASHVTTPPGIPPGPTVVPPAAHGRAARSQVAVRPQRSSAPIAKGRARPHRTRLLAQTGSACAIGPGREIELCPRRGGHARGFATISWLLVSTIRRP